MAFWRVGQGHAFIVKEDQECLRNWENWYFSFFPQPHWGLELKQPTDAHGLCNDWAWVPCRLHPDWIERFSGILWGFLLAEFWGDSRAAQEPHLAGMFCLAGPPTWVARATQPGCGDGQSLQVSIALVPDIFGHWFNFCSQKYPWSKWWAVHKRSCVFFSPSFYIIHV